MRPQIIASAARLGNAIETALSALRTGRPERSPRQLRIVAFRSLGNAQRLTVRGRVVRQATASSASLADDETTSPEHLVAVYRSFDLEEVPEFIVHAETDGSTATGKSDIGGYFEIELPPPAHDSEWSPGWHDVLLTSPDSGINGVAGVMADVFVPDLRANLVLVSDLDDTAMDSETLSSWRMLRKALFRSAKRRHPVPGVPELYQALHRGLRGVSNPVCYISSGAWNLYDIVVDYLDTHRLPRGGMYLNDWGSRQRRFRAVAHSHKSTHVSSLMTRFPALPLLLVGDDTQEDPEIYVKAALENPTRVAAIWIRKVRMDAGRAVSVGALQASVVNAGLEFVYASETEVFAEHARLRGWIDR
jgi:phosphatidate phosphatase APP1